MTEAVFRLILRRTAPRDLPGVPAMKPPSLAKLLVMNRSYRGGGPSRTRETSRSCISPLDNRVGDDATGHATSQIGPS